MPDESSKRSLAGRQGVKSKVESNESANFHQIAVVTFDLDLSLARLWVAAAIVVSPGGGPTESRVEPQNADGDITVLVLCQDFESGVKSLSIYCHPERPEPRQ
jgi:hypothetical protein